jgi:hypothetical protein
MKYTNVINGKLLKVENIYSNSNQITRLEGVCSFFINTITQLKRVHHH